MTTTIPSFFARKSQQEAETQLIARLKISVKNAESIEELQYYQSCIDALLEYCFSPYTKGWKQEMGK